MTTNGKAIVTLVFALAMVAVGLFASTAQAQTTLCCFNNWRYSGTCIVQVAPDQKCGDVLGVLNNPMSATTTYCGGTQVRGGWSTVNCGGGGGSGGTSGSSGGTITQPNYVRPVEPSYATGSGQPQTVKPEETSSKQDRVHTTQPSFVQPVKPTLAPTATGPSVLSL
jgi:hypothetical protein